MIIIKLEEEYCERDSCECEVDGHWTDTCHVHKNFNVNCVIFFSSRCITRAVGIEFDQLATEVFINKKITLIDIETELWAKSKISLWMWHVCLQKYCHIHSIGQRFLNVF